MRRSDRPTTQRSWDAAVFHLSSCCGGCGGGRMRTRTTKRATTPWKRLACFWCELGENLLRIEAWSKASSSLMAVRRKDSGFVLGRTSVAFLEAKPHKEDDAGKVMSGIARYRNCVIDRTIVLIINIIYIYI